MDPWSRRNLALGFCVGALLGLASQVLIPWVATGNGVGPSLWVRAAGVLLTALGYGSLMLLLAAVTGIALHRPVLRVASITLSVSLLTALFCWNVAALTIRVFAGSHVTIGAVDFYMNSASHMTDAALNTFGTELITLAIAAVGVAAFAARVLRPAARPHRLSIRRRLGIAAGGFALVSLLVAATTVRGAHANALSETTPELAMIDSIQAEITEAYVVTEPSRTAVPIGPSLQSSVKWREAVRRAAASPRRPNVLLLVLESFSPRHLGYEGYDREVTPNLDRIAARSLRFRKAWSTATHSNYAQMAILSALFPRRTVGLDVYRRLDYPRVLLHDFFAKAGYQTATISSQDETWQGMIRFQKTSTPTHFFHAVDHEGPWVSTGVENIVPDEVTAQRAIDWIEAQEDPWSLYVNFQMAHFPYVLPRGAKAKFANSQPTVESFTYFDYPERETPIVRNRYDNALHYVDAQVGKLWWHLRHTGLIDDTIWVITSDHGEMFHEHGVVTHGKTLYDGEARVPLLVHYPKKLGSADVDQPVSHIDILPTIAALAGLPPHPSFQGENVANPAELDERRAIFMNIQGLKVADAVVCWPYKFVLDRSRRRSHLFDLERDPNELEDLSKTRPEIALSLSKTLRAQIRAQMRYHHPRRDDQRKARYAPRMKRCPALAQDNRAL